MLFREANFSDIKAMQIVRNNVKENRLSNPALVKDEDYVDFITGRGKGWICEVDGKLVGFSIVDLLENNIWALFVHPEFEGKGIGKKLHELMMNWYFEQTQQPVWLGTAPGTRAEAFYYKAGWNANGIVNKGEVKFEMTYERWKNR